MQWQLYKTSLLTGEKLIFIILYQRKVINQKKVRFDIFKENSFFSFISRRRYWLTVMKQSLPMHYLSIWLNLVK
jgi:hypothetical protein